MKKYACLLVLVLAMSTTAWSYCQVKVCVDSAQCDEEVYADIALCCTGVCTFDEMKKCKWGNQIYVDVYLECTCLKGCSEPMVLPVKLLDDACGGVYIVIVRVWCSYEGCGCWPYNMFRRPILCGMGSTYFRVCCPQCCRYPCCCCQDDNGAPEP